MNIIEKYIAHFLEFKLWFTCALDIFFMKLLLYNAWPQIFVKKHPLPPFGGAACVPACACSAVNEQVVSVIQSNGKSMEFT